MIDLPGINPAYSKLLNELKELCHKAHSLTSLLAQSGLHGENLTRVAAIDDAIGRIHTIVEDELSEFKPA